MSWADGRVELEVIQATNDLRTSPEWALIFTYFISLILASVIFIY